MQRKRTVVRIPIDYIDTKHAVMKGQIETHCMVTYTIGIRYIWNANVFNSFNSKKCEQYINLAYV